MRENKHWRIHCCHPNKFHVRKCAQFPKDTELRKGILPECIASHDELDARFFEQCNVGNDDLIACDSVSDTIFVLQVIQPVYGGIHHDAGARSGTRIGDCDLIFRNAIMWPIPGARHMSSSAPEATTVLKSDTVYA